MTSHLQRAREFSARRIKAKKNGHHPSYEYEINELIRNNSPEPTIIGHPGLVRDLAGLGSAVELINGTGGAVGFDVETYPRDATAQALDPRRGRVGVISIAVGDLSYVIDAKVLDPRSVRDALIRALSGRTLVVHNAPFDLAFLKESFGYVHDGPAHDTLVLDAMLFYATGPRTEKDGWKGFTTKDKDSGYKRALDAVVRDRLGRDLPKDVRDEDWGGDITPEMIEYAARDAEILLPLKDKLVHDLEGLGMRDVVDLEARFTPAMSYAATNGFALDVEGWHEHAARARAALEEARAECDRIAPDPPEGIEWAWNASNHRKVGLALELLGAKVEKNPATGNYKTGESSLTAISGPPEAAALVEAILKYRANEKYVTTWGEGWFREPWLNKKGKVHANSPDHMIVYEGRVYTKFNQLVATGRGSSRQPNMQNLPPEIRKYFIAPPGRKLLIADYSQMEYVAAAHIAGDKALLAPLREGKDFHELTAEMIGIDRSRAKTVNFGVLYGMGARGLGARLGVDKDTAQGFIDALFERAPDLREWWKQRARDARNGVGYASTPLGRRRLLDMSRSEYRIRGWEANRSQMLNHPIQGACADGYKMAGALIWENRDKFAGSPLMVNMIHDEFVLEVDVETAEEDAELLKALMIDGMKRVIGNAPVKVDVTVADNWAQKG